MEKFQDLEFESSTPVLIITSSTGNGDAPDNADKFFRLCKRRTTASIFAGVPFAVCALGDSNYDAFCETGRMFDHHIERLGGVRILKRVDVDEVRYIVRHGRMASIEPAGAGRDVYPRAGPAELDLYNITHKLDSNHETTWAVVYFYF